MSSAEGSPDVSNSTSRWCLPTAASGRLYALPATIRTARHAGWGRDGTGIGMVYDAQIRQSRSIRSAPVLRCRSARVAAPTRLIRRRNPALDDRVAAVVAEAQRAEIGLPEHRRHGAGDHRPDRARSTARSTKVSPSVTSSISGFG